DKQRVMEEFAAGALDVLVATTVVEVGVDVPNATLMVIENAERFGLTQLHQLRGRVGRGAHRSVCVLIPGPGALPQVAERLQVLTRTDDGFEIAEADLELRGPGELWGVRQSGVPRRAGALRARRARVRRDPATRAAARGGPRARGRGSRHRDAPRPERGGRRLGDARSVRGSRKRLACGSG